MLSIRSATTEGSSAGLASYFANLHQLHSVPSPFTLVVGISNIAVHTHSHACAVLLVSSRNDPSYTLYCSSFLSFIPFPSTVHSPTLVEPLSSLPEFYWSVHARVPTVWPRSQAHTALQTFNATSAALTANCAVFALFSPCPSNDTTILYWVSLERKGFPQMMFPRILIWVFTGWWVFVGLS